MASSESIRKMFKGAKGKDARDLEGCERLEEAFPPFDDILRPLMGDLEKTHVSARADTAPLIGVLKAFAAFAPYTQAAQFDLEQGKAIITAKDPELGILSADTCALRLETVWAEDVAPLGLNPSLLLDCIAALQAVGPAKGSKVPPSISIDWPRDGKAPMVIRHKGSDEQSIIVILMPLDLERI